MAGSYRRIDKENFSPGVTGIVRNIFKTDMKLKFIADIHISPLTVKALQDKGYNITDKLPANASDREIIIMLAYKEKAVIITQDLDFSLSFSLSTNRFYPVTYRG
jgi:predicted nuclease of predicted toxin-antitoxin system